MQAEWDAAPTSWYFEQIFVVSSHVYAYTDTTDLYVRDAMYFYCSETRHETEYADKKRDGPWRLKCIRGATAITWQDDYDVGSFRRRAVSKRARRSITTTNDDMTR